MTKTRILIGNDELDLYPDTVAAVTLKANDIGDLTTRNASYTNSFRVPKTPNNVKIYQHSNSVRSASTFPYVKQLCKLIQNGIEIVRNGVHALRSADDKNFSVNVFGDTFDFFQKIRDKKLTDLNFDDLNGPWVATAGDIDAKRNATTGIVAPVMSYGDFAWNSGISRWDLKVYSYPASVYYHTIVDKIFAQAGYAKSGAIFSNDKYLKKILAFSRAKYEYDESFYRERYAAAKGIATTDDQNIVAAGTYIVSFPTAVTNDPLGYWNSSTGKYTVTDAGIATGKIVYAFDIACTIDLLITSTPSSIVFHIYEDGVSLGTLLTLTAVVPTGVYTFDTKVATVAFPEGILATVGKEYTVRAVVTGACNLTFRARKITITPRLNVGTGVGSAQYFNKLLPNMSQADFIKDFAITSGVVFKEKNGTIYCKTYNEIIADRANAQNWTAKKVASNAKEVSFTPLNYAKKNYFKYSNIKTAEATQVLPELGQGEVNILTNSDAPPKTIYKSPFVNTRTDYAGVSGGAGGSGPYLAIWDTNFNTANMIDGGMRVLLVRDKYSWEPTVRYNSDQTSYKVAYFNDPEQTNTMFWDQDINDHYSSFFAALNKAKLVTDEYWLTEVDIANVDFHKLIFDEDAFYMLQSVKNFIPNKSTKVELFKVS